MSVHPVGPFDPVSAQAALRSPFGVRADGTPSPDGEEEEESIGKLLGGVVTDAQTLIRKELELAKVEIEDTAKQLSRQAALMACGITVAAAGGLLLLFMATYLLAQSGLELWASYGIVGGATLVLGGIGLLIGRARLKTLDPVPHEAVDIVKKEVEWISE